MDAHHQVYAVIKLLIILFRREVGEIWCQEREVAVQAGLEAQLFEQLLFGFVETGEKMWYYITKLILNNFKLMRYELI